MLLGIHNLEKERVNTAIEAYYEKKVGDVLPHTNPTNNNNNSHIQSTLNVERPNSASNESVQPSTSSANQSISSPITSNYKSSLSSSSKYWDNVFNMLENVLFSAYIYIYKNNFFYVILIEAPCQLVVAKVTDFYSILA